MSNRFCTCSTYCSIVDPDTGIRRSGALLPSSTYQNHQRDQALKQATQSMHRPIQAPLLPDIPFPSLLQNLTSEVKLRIKYMVLPSSLFFRHPSTPDVTKTFEYPSVDPIPDPNSGDFALSYAKSSNSTFLAHESRLIEILRTLNNNAVSEEREQLEDLIKGELYGLWQFKEREWNKQQSVVTEGADLDHAGVCYNTDVYFKSHRPRSSGLRVFLLAIAAAMLIYHVSRRVIRLILIGFRLSQKVHSSSPSVAQETPIDPHTILKDFHLDPVTITYICCQSCYALYRHDDTRKARPGAEIPLLCTNKATPTSPVCKHPLWKEIQIGTTRRDVARLKYVHRSLKDWLGRILARPGMENILDRCTQSLQKENMEDIHDSPAWHLFLGPDGQPFITTGKLKNEGRYIFSFGMDGFNPFQAKQAKQSVSSTAIYLILLNLPPELRYLPENIYLAGVIPGHPPLDAINHFLALVVDEFIEFWDPGVRFSRTYNHSKGVLCRAVLMPVVCDMPAARQASGFSSPTSTFFCTQDELRIQRIFIIDRDQWPKRDANEHRRRAMLWRDAETEEIRQSLFEKYQVRWSELLRLTYWNPILFTIIDSMHLGPLGLFPDHCRVVWGIDVSVDGGDGTEVSKPLVRPSQTLIRQCLESIRDFGDSVDILEKKLSNGPKKAVLWHICRDNGLSYGGKKAQLIDNIIEWRTEVGTHGIIVPLPEPTPTATPEPSMGSRQPSQAPSNSSLATQFYTPTTSTPVPIAPAVTQQVGYPTTSSLQIPNEGSFIAHRPRQSEAPMYSSHSRGPTPDIPQGSTQRILDPGPSSQRTVGTSLDASSRAGVGASHIHHPIPVPVQNFNFGPSPTNAQDVFIFGRTRDLELDEITTSHGGTIRYISADAEPPDEHRSKRPRVQRTPVNRHEVRPTNVAEKKAKWHNGTLTKSMASSLRQSELIALCRDLGLDYPANHDKNILITILMGSMGSDGKGEGEKAKPRHVLGKSVMEEIRKDMENSILPPSLIRAPLDWGTARRGKLSADQWRVICTIHLPVTLVRLWGPSPVTRRRQMIENFMHLYKAMETAQNRVISKDHITSYDTHIVQYLKGVNLLYRDFAMKPIHHMAQHLGEFMLRMGPVHAYRVPAFERLNYLMQQENTNLKIGELEATFLHTTSKASHLRALLKEDAMIHQEAKELVDAYLAMESEGRRNIGILSDEPGHPVSKAVAKPCFLDLNTMRALDKFTGETPIYVSDSFEDVESVVVDGVEYRSAKRHLRGSFVLYTSTEGEERPAQIMQLFRHPRVPTTTYFALKRFELADLPAHVLDPYRRFDIGFLASTQQEETIVVTSFSNITCPFVKTKVSVGGVDLIHVFPFSRVRQPFRTHDYATDSG